jgi:hypothetical protein
MLIRKELRHSRDLIEKTEARLSYEKRLVSSHTLDERLQLLGGELIASMELRLSHMQSLHLSLLAAAAAENHQPSTGSGPAHEGGGSAQPRP